MRFLLAALVGASHAQAGSSPTEVQASVTARQNLIAVCPEVSARCGVPTGPIANTQDLATSLNCMLKVDLSKIPRGSCYDTMKAFLANHMVPIPGSAQPSRQVPPMVRPIPNGFSMRTRETTVNVPPLQRPAFRDFSGRDNKPWESDSDDRRRPEDDRRKPEDDRRVSSWDDRRKPEDDRRRPGPEDDRRVSSRDDRRVSSRDDRRVSSRDDRRKPEDGEREPWDINRKDDRRSVPDFRKTWDREDKDDKQSKKAPKDEDRKGKEKKPWDAKQEKSKKDKDKDDKPSKSRKHSRDDVRSMMMSKKDFRRANDDDDDDDDDDDKRPGPFFMSHSSKRSYRNDNDDDDKRPSPFFMSHSSKRSYRNDDDDDDKRPGPFFMSHSSKRSYRNDDDDDDKRPGPFFMSHSSKRSFHDRDDQRPGFSMWHKKSSGMDERRSFPWSQDSSSSSKRGFSKWHNKDSFSDDKRFGFPFFNKHQDEDDNRRPPFFMWRQKDDGDRRSMFGGRFSSRQPRDEKMAPFAFSRGGDRFSSSSSQYRPPMFDRSFGLQQMSGPSPTFFPMMQQRPPMSQEFVPRTPAPSLDLGAVIKALIARSAAAQSQLNEPSVEIALKGPVNTFSPEIAAPRN